MNPFIDQNGNQSDQRNMFSVGMGNNASQVMGGMDPNQMEQCRKEMPDRYDNQY